MKIFLATALLILSSGCQTGDSGAAAATGAAGAPDHVISDLVRSQSQPYAVPATASGVAFSVSATSAAVRWATLSEEQLRAWWLLWSDARLNPARPKEAYTDDQGQEANLFDRSARDGFCVAFAHDASGKLSESSFASFLGEL